MRLNLKQIAQYTGGTFVVDPVDSRTLATGITWDSREIKQGDAYVALSGQRVDGHTFVSSAFCAGASCALVMQPLDEATLVLAREMGAAIIEVPNTAHALVDLANEWRSHLQGTVIALTGSSGKTTTKNLVRDVLSAEFSVIATTANQNNELGVPRTILRAEQDTQVIVVEMGMRGLGQITELCDYVRPDWAIVVNVGESHIELLGSRENIARAKAEIFCALPEGCGRAFVNAAEEFTPFICDHAQLKTRRVARVLFDGSDNARAHCVTHNQSLNDSADVREPAVWAENIALDNQGCPSFDLHAINFEEGVEEVHACRLHLRGLHNVSNACAAAAVGRSFGMSLESIARALINAEAESGRQEVTLTPRGYTVVNDAYNANPESMRASLRTFESLKPKERHIAVLGDMGELGSFAQACHEDIGSLCAQLSLDQLVCVGELANYIADAAIADGFDKERIQRASSVSEALSFLETYLEKDDVVLVKASHFMGLERVVEGLIN